MSYMAYAYPMLDLSGLSKLGLLFTALFQAFWPIFVVIFVASILLALLGIGAKFGLGGIFKVSNFEKVNVRRSKIAFSLLLAVTVLVLLMSSTTVQAAPTADVTVLVLFAPLAVSADGTAGTLEIGVTNILDSTPITIRMYDLTVAADFKVNWTGDATGHSFTTGSVQTEHYITVNIDKPSGSHDVTVYLIAQAAGNDSNSLDSLTLYVSDTSIFPDDIIIDIGIVIAVVFIIVAVVTTIKKKG